jgi:hypothetical protein
MVELITEHIILTVAHASFLIRNQLKGHLA